MFKGKKASIKSKNIYRIHFTEKIKDATFKRQDELVV